MTNPRLLAAATLVAVLALGMVRVPGTAVSLDPPQGFVRAERYPGFEDAGRRSSIMVTELPGPAATMRRGMTREALLTRGMTQIGRETTTVGGQPATVLHVRQEANGEEFEKWMLIAGNDARTIMVVGTLPRGDSELSLQVREAVLSTTWSVSAPKSPSKYEGLAFRVDPTPKLKLAGRVANMLVFSESGTMEPSDVGASVLIVGSSLAEKSVTDVEAFARERAGKTDKIGPLRDIEGRAVTADGLPGYELVARTNDAKTGRELRMYQLVLADTSTYYLAQGFVAPERAEAALDQFRQVTGSFRRVGLRAKRP